MTSGLRSSVALTSVPILRAWSANPIDYEYMANAGKFKQGSCEGCEIYPPTLRLPPIDRSTQNIQSD